MEKKITVKPDMAFIQCLKRMTDWNDHGGVYLKIAQWCAKNCEGESKEIFTAFASIFKIINKTHLEIGHLAYGLGETRYETGRQMDELIGLTFCEETLEMLRDGQR